MSVEAPIPAPPNAADEAFHQHLMLNNFRLIRPLNSRPPQDELWHYTSHLENLETVLQGRVRLTHHSKLSDPREIKYGASLAEKYHKLALEKIDRDPVLARVLDGVGKVVFPVQDLVDLHCFCMTDIPDGTHQWESYGTGDERFAMVLSDEGLRGSHLLDQTTTATLVKVTYGREKQDVFLRDSYAKTIAFGKRHRPHLKKSEFAQIDLAAALSELISIGLVSFKDPQFSWEREWRIVNRGRIGSGPMQSSTEAIFLDARHDRSPFGGRVPLVGVKASPNAKLSRQRIDEMLTKTGLYSLRRHE